MVYFLHIIKSRAKSWYYVGITSDVVKRLKEHSSGKTRSTKAHRPFDIVYTERYPNKEDCRRREICIKANHALKQSLIEKSNMALSSNG